MEQQIPGSLEEAEDELFQLEQQIRTGGRVHYGLIFGLIGMVILGMSLAEGAEALPLALGAGLTLLGGLFGLGALPSSLPHRYGGEAYHERVAFLRGFIASRQPSRDGAGRSTTT